MSDPKKKPDQTPELSDDELEDVSGGRAKLPITIQPIEPLPTFPPIRIDPPQIYPLPPDAELDI